MSLTGLILDLLIGGFAGWLCGVLTRGAGFGVVGNVIVGVIGAFLGGLVLGILGFAAYGLPARVISAVLGAMLFVWLLRFIKR